MHPLAGAQAGIVQRDAAGFDGLLHQVFDQRFQLGAGQLDVEVLRARGVGRDERQVDVVGRGGGEGATKARVMAEAAEVSSPHLRMCQAAGLLHLQHQPPQPRRLDAQRRRSVHLEWLGGVRMEIRPWLGGSMNRSIEFSRLRALVAATSCDRTGPRQSH